MARNYDEQVLIVDGNGAPLGTGGNPVVTSGAGGGGSSAVTVADCADVTQGCIADAAVTGDTAGTVNSHLRGLGKVFAPEDVNGLAPSNRATVNARGYMFDLANNFWRYMFGGAINGDVAPSNFYNGLSVAATKILNAGGTPQYERVPINFKSAAATANGSTAVWTPAAGKKFRLLRYMLIVTDNATQAGAGVLTFKLLDGAADIAQVHDVFVPAVALSNNGVLYVSPWIEIGPLGILSAAANNVLNINLSAALVTGNCRVMVCGTEE